MQLKQAVTSRDMSDDTCRNLQDELSDLKEQLQMYESAAELGVLAGKESPKISESFAHLGVRNLDQGDWETPKSHRLVYVLRINECNTYICLYIKCKCEQ